MKTSYDLSVKAPVLVCFLYRTGVFLHVLYIKKSINNKIMDAVSGSDTVSDGISTLDEIPLIT